MPRTPKLTPFSYAILTLVGESGAGAHDLVRMMRQGTWVWTAADSQYYAEPKRLEAMGLLSARREPGRTRERTVYELTAAGRRALRAWLATPTGPVRIQDEPAVRLLAAEFVAPEVTLASLGALREALDAADRAADVNERQAAGLPHRERVLLINHRLVRRLIAAHRAWLAEVEEELGDAAES